MTHILVSLADWEALRSSEGFLDEESKNEALVTLVARSKEIALDEQSIDERIKEERPPLTFIAGEYHGLEKSQGFSRGYKKAIKDLL